MNKNMNAGFAARHHHPHPGFGGFGPGMGFGPDMRRDFAAAWGGGRARKGDVRIAILALLAEGPASGYALIKTIAERTEQLWRPSAGSVYPTLQQLADEGLVVPPEGRGDFELSDDGKKYVDEHREELGRVFETGARPQGPDVEFMQSIGRLFEAVKQFPRSATAEQRATATEKMDELRRELYRILAD